MKKIFFVLFLALLWACSDDDENNPGLADLSGNAPFELPVLEWGVSPEDVEARMNEFVLERDSIYESVRYTQDIYENRYPVARFTAYSNEECDITYYFDEAGQMNMASVLYEGPKYSSELLNYTYVYLERVYGNPYRVDKYAAQERRSWIMHDVSIDVNTLGGMILSIGFYNPAAIVE